MRTDHAPIVGLHRKRDLMCRVARWQCFLAEYSLRIETQAGRQHLNANGMSRMRSEDVVPEANEDVDDDGLEYRAYTARANTVVEKYQQSPFYNEILLEHLRQPVGSSYRVDAGSCGA